jgi:hypothetical protein
MKLELHYDHLTVQLRPFNATQMKQDNLLKTLLLIFDPRMKILASLNMSLIVFH